MIKNHFVSPSPTEINLNQEVDSNPRYLKEATDSPYSISHCANFSISPKSSENENSLYKSKKSSQRGTLPILNEKQSQTNQSRLRSRYSKQKMPSDHAIYKNSFKSHEHPKATLVSSFDRKFQSNGNTLTLSSKTSKAKTVSSREHCQSE